MAQPLIEYLTPSPGQLLLQNGSVYSSFQDPVEIITTRNPEDIKSALQELNDAVARFGYYAAGFLTYEAAAAYRLAVRQPDSSDLPLLWFGLYQSPRTGSLPVHMGSSYQLGPWRLPVDEITYSQAIKKIKKHIARGHTYQVNYTMQLQAPFSGDPWSLFLDLTQAQQGAHMAYLDLGDHVICSASPELFFRQDGDRLLSKPMKGTGKRGLTTAEDRQQIAMLQASPKDRAENVMIVDMIRNDLGRVAQIGTVQVPELFTVEKYPTLLQMTSTVTADSRAGMPEIMEAMFPCASITGAPKVRTMEIIKALEQKPRGIYTGTIGFWGPDRQANFNVAIRTVVIDRSKGAASFGVGSGIVWDSEPLKEYAECQLKSQVLVKRQPAFDLIESLLWTPEEGYYLLDLHLDRLALSAEYFNYPYDEKSVRLELLRISQRLENAHKVRILLGKGGSVVSQASPLAEGAKMKSLRVGLAQSFISSDNLWLYHKTTHRVIYEQMQASRPDVDQVILWNERSEVTETFTNNIVLNLDGRLVTPPVSSGLLAGTFRQHLLQEGMIQEQVITVPDLVRCQEIFLINSVRLWQKARFIN